MRRFSSPEAAASTTRALNTIRASPVARRATASNCCRDLSSRSITYGLHLDIAASMAMRPPSTRTPPLDAIVLHACISAGDHLGAGHPTPLDPSAPGSELLSATSFGDGGGHWRQAA